MGKKKKLHREKVVWRNAMLNNPLTRGAIKLASRGKVIEELNKASTSELVEVMGVATKKPSKLANAIKNNAPRKMDEAIMEFLKEGREITVESLTDNVKNTPGFLTVCERVGITLEWFENLAKQRMEAMKI